MVDDQEIRDQEVTKRDQKYTQEPIVCDKAKREVDKVSRQMMSIGGVFVILYFLMGGIGKAGERM